MSGVIGSYPCPTKKGMNDLDLICNMKTIDTMVLNP